MNIKIGGFQKNTLIDFPGVVASLVFTQGCNFRCPYCHNPGLIPFLYSDESCVSGSSGDLHSFIPTFLSQSDPALTKKTPLIEESEIFAFLKKRKGLIDGVAITGGEPTLQPALEPFCFKLKNMGLKVKVDTNGSRPDVLHSLFKRKLVDFVAMDIKSNQNGYQYIAGGLLDNDTRVPGKNELYTPIFDFSLILKSIRLIIENAPAYEFRTTCVKPFISSEIILDIGSMIKGASHYVIQHCSKNINMLNSSFFQNHDPFFNDFELQELKSTVEEYVGHCSIR